MLKIHQQQKVLTSQLADVKAHWHQYLAGALILLFKKAFLNYLTLHLICQFWAFPIQQQVENMMSKIWTNAVQLSDRVENVGKGEIARYELFLLFPQCFQKRSFNDSSK